MKRFLLSMALLLAFCVPWAHAQIIFSEGFEGGSLPTGWSTDGPGSWTFNGAGVHSQYSSVTTAYAGSYNAKIINGTSGNVTKLITPVIDLSGRTSATLTFAYVNPSYDGDIDELRVYYRQGSAAQWTLLASYTAATSAWTVAEITLTENLTNEYQLAFEMTDLYGYGVGIDEVTIEAPLACEVLQTLTASATSASVTANWTLNNGVTNCVGYEVKLSTSSNPDTAGLSTQTISDPATLTYTFEHLERETQYYVHARVNCGTTNNYSEWSTTTVTTKDLSICNMIGDGNIESYMPYAAFGSNYFQQIFTASELLAQGVFAGPIKGITYTWIQPSPDYYPVAKNMTIYMGQSTKESYSSVSDWAPASIFTECYNDANMSPVMGTQTYTFTTPFVWDGVSNIVIAVSMNCLSTGQRSTFFTSVGSNCGANRCIYMVKDAYQYGIDPTVTSEYNNRFTSSVRSNVTFCQILDTCPAVTNVTSSDITVNSAVISWTQSTGDYANTCDVIVSDSAITVFEGKTITHAAINGTTDTLTGLTRPYSLYYVYVRANCNGYGHNEGNSNWVEHIFRTEPRCEYPRNVAAKTIGKNAIRIDWTNKQGESTAGNNYEYYYSKTMVEPTGAGTATTAGYAEITGLAYDSTYYCYVRKVCGGEDGESFWIMDSVKTHPYLPPVVNLTASNIAHNAFTATWNRNDSLFANETQWEYACTINDSIPTVWTTATDSLIIVTGLDATTEYNLYVRPTDGAGNYGEFRMISVTTATPPTSCVTLYDGTNKSESVPFYPYYCDAYTKSNTIMLASELQSIAGKKIESMTFYAPTDHGGNTGANWQFFLKEVDDATVSAPLDVTTATKVYEGTVATDREVITITFNTPFTYSGNKNLMIAAQNTTIGNYKAVKFAGTTVTYGRSGAHYSYNSLANVNSLALQSFVPKTTFCYENDETRPAPQSLNVDQITTTTARAIWYPGASETAWQYYVSTVYMDSAALSTAATTATTSLINPLNGLTKDTDYLLYVRANYGDSVYSEWAQYRFTTLPTCSAPINAQAANTDDNEITFDAAAGQCGTVGTYDYRYWRVGTTDTTTVAGQNSQYIATNVPGGYYNWEVRANCSGTDEGSSRWVAGNTVRVCGIRSLPYTQNSFMDVPDYFPGPGTIENICWNDLNASGSYPAYVRTGDQSFNYLTLYASSITDLYLIMPEFANAADYRVSFYWGVSNTAGASGNLYIGYMTDITADSTFVKCDSIMSRSIPVSYQLNIFTTYLRNIPAGARIALCYAKTPGYRAYRGFLYDVAVDTIPLYTLSDSVAPVSTYGNVEIICNATDTAADGRFYENTTPSLKATANPGFFFTDWSNGQTADSITIRMMSNTLITANFDSLSYNLSVDVDPAYASLGTVSGSGTFKYLSNPQITASPVEHYHVVWEDGNLDNPRTITMPAHDTTYTATFAIDTFTVTLISNPDSLGSVEGAGRYTWGQTATLRAVPNEHQEFVNWSNGERTEEITIVVTQDTTLTAYFKTIINNVTVLPNDTAMGSVTGEGEYNQGTDATLSATANEHYHFTGWSNGATTPQITFTVSQDSVMVATFAIDRHNISTAVNDPALGSVTGAGEYNYGEQVTLTATAANSHVIFQGWSDGETAATRNVTVAGDATYTAIFALDGHFISAVPNNTAMGIVTGSSVYAHGDTATLVATAKPHYHFVNWSNGSLDATIMVVANSAASFTANFAIDRHVISTSVNNLALGSVTGAGEYDYNAQVTLTAVPAGDHVVFTGWSDGVTDATRNVTVAGDATYTANFALDTHDITGTSAGHGQVTGSATVAHGNIVTLTATASAHYHFDHWSNGATANVISIFADRDSSVIAYFAIDQHVVDINVNNNALGSVSGAGTYNYGAAVTMTATPANAHCRFTGWNDGVTTASRTINVTGDITYTANFAVDQHTVTANVNDPAMGTVTGAGTFTHGDEVTLTATPAAHHHLVDWSNGATTNVLNFIADQNYTLTANFAIDQYQINGTSSDETMGTVTGSGTYNYGAAVTLTATPAAHYHFIGWSNGETSNVITMSANADVNLVAFFEIDTYTVTADIVGNGYVFGEGTFEYGTTVTLYAIPDPGWQFDGWSDGTASDTLTFVIDRNVTYTATFSLIPTPPTGVEEVETFNYVAYSENLDIIINGVADHNVAVYDMAGRLVKMITNAAAEERVTVHAAGVYLIRVDNFNATRVVVK